AGLAVLERGEVLGIYPEGTRSPDGRLHRGKTGVARLALASGAPVVPVAMLGAHEAQRGRRWFPRRRPRIHALVGPPVDVQAVLELNSGAGEATVLRAVTDAVMDSIDARSGQERVDEYGSGVKQRLRAAADGAPPGLVGCATVAWDRSAASGGTGYPGRVTQFDPDPPSRDFSLSLASADVALPALRGWREYRRYHQLVSPGEPARAYIFHALRAPPE